MKSKSCDVFNEEIMQQPTLLSDGKIAMTFVKQHECQERVNYKLLSKAFSNTDFGGFISALESVKDDPADESREILTQLMNSEEVDSSVREESRRRLIGSARNMGELEPFLNEWNKESGGLEWEKTGKALFNRLSQMKKYKESLVVGETLAPFSKNNLPLQKALVKSAVKSGESFTAWKMLKNFKNRQNLRAPASDNDYEKIEKALIKEFGAL